MSEQIPAPVPNASPRRTLVELCSLRLVAPSTEVEAVEAASALDVADRPPGALAWVRCSGGRWSVHGLDNELRACEDPPPGEGRVHALIRHAGGLLGLACLSAREPELETGDVRVWPLPGCMRSPSSPIAGLAVLGKRLACTLSPDRLARMLGHGEIRPGTTMEDVAR